jgi:hypothetical protein
MRTRVLVCAGVLAAVWLLSRVGSDADAPTEPEKVVRSAAIAPRPVANAFAARHVELGRGIARDAEAMLRAGASEAEVDAEMVLRYGAERDAIAAEEEAALLGDIAAAARELEPTPADLALDAQLRADPTAAGVVVTP